MRETDIKPAPDRRTHATKVREGKRRKGPHPQFVGWRGDDFLFMSETGYQAKLTGPREGTIRSLRKFMPHWFAIAKEHKQGAFAQAIHREAVRLGIVIYAVRERDPEGYEVVDDPDAKSKPVAVHATELEALADAKIRNANVAQVLT